MSSKLQSRVPWFRSISVKLALALGLAIFATYFLTSIFISELFISETEDKLRESEGAEQPPSRPYVTYLQSRLEPTGDGRWKPTEEALEVISTFLGYRESYLWLDADDEVMVVGPGLENLVTLGETWSLCANPAYCTVEFKESERGAGSTWQQLAINGRAIGTFVLLWFESDVATQINRSSFRVGLLVRLGAAALLAALTSVLLVRLVTGRLSKLAFEAAAPFSEGASEGDRVGLPGPFNVQGDDEIAQLAQALNTMRRRIEDLVDKLAERDRQRREWVAMVSHDLRTPLTALSVCLERIGDRIEGSRELNERTDVLEAIHVAREDGNRLHTLVDDLFELARLDAGETLFLEPVPPGELVRQTVRGLRPMAEDQGKVLEAHLASHLPTVMADGRRLLRALENLVRNAVRFARTRVDVGVKREGDQIVLSVADDGPGLPMKDGEVILGKSDEAGARSDSAGLGLIVARRVAEAHGGRLAGENTPEGGARVSVYLPLATADELIGE